MEADFYGAALDHLATGLLVVDRAGRVLVANELIRSWMPALRPGDVVEPHLDACGAQNLDGSELALDAWPLAIAMATGASTAIEIACAVGPDPVVLRLSAFCPTLDTVAMTVTHATREYLAREAETQAVAARARTFAVMAHDLRSPLNAVSIAVEGLGDPLLPATSRERYVAAIRRAVSRADTLIGTLLEARPAESPAPAMAAPVTAAATPPGRNPARTA